MCRQTSRQSQTISAMCGTTMDTSLSISSSKTSNASLAWSLKEIQSNLNHEDSQRQTDQLSSATLTVFSTSSRNIMKSLIRALAYEHSKTVSKCPHLVCLNEALKSNEQFGDQRLHQVLKERKTTF